MNNLCANIFLFHISNPPNAYFSQNLVECLIAAKELKKPVLILTLIPPEDTIAFRDRG